VRRFFLLAPVQAAQAGRGARGDGEGRQLAAGASTDYPADDWTEAVGDAGFMALAGVSGNSAYRDAMLEMGRKNRWRLGPSLYHADDQAVGQTYAELYQQLRDPAMIAPMRAQFDNIIEEPRDGTLDFLVPGVLMRWSWCDSLFMGPPAWRV
jgi:rhamnogalacturonyl hydrolase YesR